jgi:two-component system chemotaxis response regulator CheB
MVAMVASLGGVHAVSSVLSGLPENFAVPVAVTVHGRVSPDPARLGRVLQRSTRLRVRTATPLQPLDAGVTVIASGQAATIDALHRLNVADAVDKGVGDALLMSAASQFGPGLIAVVLTGRMRDGAEGARAVKRHGGRVLVQDPATAEAREMPANAMATGCVDFVLALEHIAPALVALTMAPGGAELLRVPTPAWVQLSPQPS